MADTKQKYLTYVENILQDASQELQPDDKVRALDQAVRLYSKDKPYEKVHEITGDGSTYDHALPTDWEDGFSFIVGSIEYPADDYQEPAYIEEDSWMFYKKLVSTVTTTYFRTLTWTAASSDKIRFVYAIRHVLSDSSCTIFESDFEAVASLAAAICFWALAAKFAQSQDSSIDADVVDYQRKSELYAELAKNRFNYYNTLMGKTNSKERGAANVGVQIKDIDLRYQFGDEMLVHSDSMH